MTTDRHTAEALDELLGRCPGALVAALGPDGIVPFPTSVPLHGQAVFDALQGIDVFSPETQLVVLEAWGRCRHEPMVSVDAHLLAEPDRLVPLHFFDVREEHGVHVVVLEGADVDLVWRSLDARATQRRPSARVTRDASAVFTTVDAGTTAMLGWPPEALIGRPTIDFVHPDDTERAIEGWLTMRSGTGSGRQAVRFRHADGHYLWVEVTNDNQLDDPAIGVVRSDLVDISEEMARLEELQQRERQLARLAEALPIGICHLRVDGEAVYSNEPFVDLLGPTDGRTALVMNVMSDDRPQLSARLDQALAGLAGELEVGVLHGIEERRCELSFRPLRGEADGIEPAREIDGVIVCASDVTDRSRLRSELEHRATHDALSGCLNRGAAVSALEAALLTSPRVTVAYIDLDGFKAVNDELGHAAGDDLLRVVASRLRTVVRSGDLIGRIGGDEFIIICPQTSVAVDEQELVTRLGGALNSDITFAGRWLPLRASVGVVTSEPGESDAEALLTRADAAMYRAKGRADRQYSLIS